MEKCDVLIIGAGPGGLAAAKGAKEAGAKKVVVLERDNNAGGILNQCIHDGFGLIRYRKQLTGPEYALLAEKEAREAGATILTGHQVISITKEKEVTAVSRDGLQKIQAGAIVLATGCRERTRGAISIPGTRPAGVFTAGVVQNLVNIRNIMPGKRIVILGSGDVGMIMARRLTLEGAEVKAVVEILPEPAGLARNVSQCLYDFSIPILCRHTISRIIGEKKLTAVEISKLDHEMKPIKGTEETIECDALVLSVGLIPENEVAETAGVELEEKTNGTKTDKYMQTSIPGIFSCGNSHRVMDLADFVSEQGEIAGKNAVLFCHGNKLIEWNDAEGNSMIKGYPVPDTVTCPLCPNGCQVKWNNANKTYEGNKCLRGKQFAEQERTAPKRMLTTTVLFDGEEKKLIPVKTEVPVSKEKIPILMKEIGKIRLNSSVTNGETIYKFIDGEKAIPIITTGKTQ